MTQTGFLITFEGGEGGGKTTQIPLIAQRLQAVGREVLTLREPGGTKISEQIREVVLSAKNTGMADTTEVLLFQAARAQIYDELVLPALKAGQVVLMDRSRDSSVVYQGMVRGFGKDLIEQLNTISTQKTYPNLTFLLDLDAQEGLRRRFETNEADRIEKEGMPFHEQVRQGYLELAQADQSGRWVVIDAGQSLEQVTDAIWQKLQFALGL